MAITNKELFTVIGNDIRIDDRALSFKQVCDAQEVEEARIKIKDIADLYGMKVSLELEYKKPR